MKYIDLFEKFVIKQYNNPGLAVQGPGSRSLTKNGSEKVRKQDLIVATDDTIHQIVRDEIKKLGKDADLNHIDVSQVTNMKQLFLYTDFQGDISQWDVSRVKYMSGMFGGCTNFNQDISNWDVRMVESMYGMFNGCTSFNQDLSGWNVSSVTNMCWMFADCTSFNQDLSGWNVSKVKNINDMFFGCPIKEEYKPKFK